VAISVAFPGPRFHQVNWIRASDILSLTKRYKKLSFALDIKPEEGEEKDLSSTLIQSRLGWRKSLFGAFSLNRDEKDG